MDDRAFKVLFVESYKKAIKKINICYYPGCENKSINSHIFQENGILNQLAKNSHVWEKKINNYSENIFYFDKEGLDRVFSFNCFCNHHDNNIFGKIENKEIIFEEYESCLLFTIRSLYNEIWRKQVVIKQFSLMMKSDYSSKLNLELMTKVLLQQSLGIEDLRKLEDDIWKDYKTDSQNFIFKFRIIERIDICLSAFYDYETTNEMKDYLYKNGKQMDRLSKVFINIFPYKNQTILLMGYHKEDEIKLKPYVNTLFKESEKILQTKLTNLLIFNCENWILSENLYKKKIEKIEPIFTSAIRYALRNNNERQFFKLNIFKENFINEIKKLQYIFNQ